LIIWELPIQTLKVGSLGTHKALGLAKEKNARFLIASTRKFTGTRSSIADEDYWAMSHIGPRGCYDEPNASRGDDDGLPPRAPA